MEVSFHARRSNLTGLAIAALGFQPRDEVRGQGGVAEKYLGAIRSGHARGPISRLPLCLRYRIKLLSIGEDSFTKEHLDGYSAINSRISIMKQAQIMFERHSLLNYLGLSRSVLRTKTAIHVDP